MTYIDYIGAVEKFRADYKEPKEDFFSKHRSFTMLPSEVHDCTKIVFREDFIGTTKKLYNLKDKVRTMNALNSFDTYRNKSKEDYRSIVFELMRSHNDSMPDLIKNALIDHYNNSIELSRHLNLDCLFEIAQLFRGIESSEEANLLITYVSDGVLK